MTSCIARTVVILAFGMAAAGCEDKKTPTAPSAPTTTVMSISGVRVLQVGQTETYILNGVPPTSPTSPGPQPIWNSTNTEVLRNDVDSPALAGPKFRAAKEGESTVEVTLGQQKATLPVLVVGLPASSTPVPPSVPPPAPTDPPVNQSPASLSAANGNYPITGSASPDPCTSFPLTYVGDMTISGVRDDGTGGSGLLRKNGVASPYGSSVTVRREGTGFIIEFTARLAINGSFYDYTMRWNIGGLTPGATFTGTQALNGPCSAQGTVRGTKQN